MEFNDDKPIYKQIVDYAFNCIIEGIWAPSALIPSVRELSIEMGVNTRTVLKAFEDLQSLGVIEPKRGMGFLLATDAPYKVAEARRHNFFKVTVPVLVAEMNRLGISTSELIEHIDSQNNKL